MHIMGMDIRTADMTTQMIPMLVTSMKTAIHTMTILNTTIHIIITLLTIMLIMTIPTTTTAIMITPLQGKNTKHITLTTMITYMIIFIRDQR